MLYIKLNIQCAEQVLAKQLYSNINQSKKEKIIYKKNYIYWYKLIAIINIDWKVILFLLFIPSEEDSRII